MKNIKETDTHIVVELVKDSGSKYEVGYPKEAGYTKESVEEMIAAPEGASGSDSDTGNLKDNGDYKDLKWTLGDEQDYTSRAAKGIGIGGGYIVEGSKIVTIYYDYRICFMNTKGWGFKFKDENGDTYSCSTVLNGSHYIDYNSSAPTIVGVK